MSSKNRENGSSGKTFDTDVKRYFEEGRIYKIGNNYYRAVGTGVAPIEYNDLNSAERENIIDKTEENWASQKRGRRSPPPTPADAHEEHDDSHAKTHESRQEILTVNEETLGDIGIVHGRSEELNVNEIGTSDDKFDVIDDKFDVGEDFKKPEIKTKTKETIVLKKKDSVLDTLGYWASKVVHTVLGPEESYRTIAMSEKGKRVYDKLRSKSPSFRALRAESLRKKTNGKTAKEELRETREIILSGGGLSAAGAREITPGTRIRIQQAPLYCRKITSAKKEEAKYNYMKAIGSTLIGAGIAVLGIKSGYVDNMAKYGARNISIPLSEQVLLYEEERHGEEGNETETGDIKSRDEVDKILTSIAENQEYDSEIESVEEIVQEGGKQKRANKVENTADEKTANQDTENLSGKLRISHKYKHGMLVGEKPTWIYVGAEAHELGLRITKKQDGSIDDILIKHFKTDEHMEDNNEEIGKTYVLLEFKDEAKQVYAIPIMNDRRILMTGEVIDLLKKYHAEAGAEARITWAKKNENGSFNSLASVYYDRVTLAGKEKGIAKKKIAQNLDEGKERLLEAYRSSEIIGFNNFVDNITENYNKGGEAKANMLLEGSIAENEYLIAAALKASDKKVNKWNSKMFNAAEIENIKKTAYDFIENSTGLKKENLQGLQAHYEEILGVSPGRTKIYEMIKEVKAGLEKEKLITSGTYRTFGKREVTTAARV